MKSNWLTMMIAALLAACGNSPGVGDEANTQPQAQTIAAEQVYRCGDTQFQARFEADSVRIRFNDEERLLSRTVSGSGARYQNGDWLFWTKGEEAMLDAGVQSLRNCRLVEQGAAADHSD